MEPTTFCGRHHGQIVVDSATMTSSFLECYVLMLCPRPWYLAQFGRGGMVWASFACFINHQGLKNDSFIYTLGLKRLKFEIKIETSKNQA